MRRNGFTLVELIISFALIVIIGALAMAALQSANVSMDVAAVKSEVQGDVRDVMRLMQEELQLAAKEGDSSLSPPLEPLEIIEDPVEGSPVEIAFQVPLDDSGLNWSTRIRFRYINEDENGNARLDVGEDLDGDGVLARRILRLEDRNGDGTIDEGEQRIVGAASTLGDVQFTLDGDVLTISLTAGKLMRGRRVDPVSVSATGKVYLLN